MWRKLDSFDWEYNQSDIWMTFFAHSLLWPFLLINPQKLLRPDFISEDDFSFDRAQGAREKVRFMENPPPCGAVTSYRPLNRELPRAETGDEFLFSAADVEATAKNIKQEHPSIEGIGGVIRWTEQRDEALIEQTPVPEILVFYFDRIASSLLAARKGRVRCSSCDAIYPTSLLAKNTSREGGYVDENYCCPAGHTLFTNELMHFFMGS